MRSRMRLAGLAAVPLLLSFPLVAQTTPPAATPTPAPAPMVETGGKEGLTIRGFISASLYGQDQNFSFGNGQNAEWPLPPQTTKDRWITSEMDFFGGNNGTGAFADQQMVPRLRFAFADIGNGMTTIRIGQFWSPLFGNVPVSNSHIAFPLGYGSGMPGWRYPGVFVYQQLTPKGAPVSAELQVAVMRGNWDNTPGSNVNSVSPGNAGTPQFEARFNLGGKAGDGTWGIYVVGHYDQKDLSGPNAETANDKLDGTIGEFGARFTIGGFLIHGNVYTAKNAGQQFTAITQFGKLKSTGGWIQAGYDFTKNWGAFLFYAIDDPDDKETLAALGNAARLKNTIYNGMLRWRTGPYSLGLEYLHAELTSGTAKVKTKGNQVSLSALYNF
jgi:hypothetical protein